MIAMTDGRVKLDGFAIVIERLPVANEGDDGFMYFTGEFVNLLLVKRGINEVAGARVDPWRWGLAAFSAN